MKLFGLYLFLDIYFILFYSIVNTNMSVSLSTVFEVLHQQWPLCEIPDILGEGSTQQNRLQFLGVQLRFVSFRYRKLTFAFIVV